MGYSIWEDIPHHLLELFLKPLETAETPNLSRVCKAWGEFKPPKPESCFPEIVHGSIFKLIKGKDEVDKYLLRRCLGSSHGWLIIRMEKLGDDGPNEEELYYLVNSETKDTIQLPILWNHNPDYPSIFFSSAPTDPNCIALMFDASFPGFLFSKRGGGCNNNKWIESECEYPLYAKPIRYTNVKKDCLHSAIALGGKFYALSFRGNLVAIDIDYASDLDHPTSTLTVLPANSIFPLYPCPWGMRVGYDWFLVESLGKLLVVRLYRRETDSELLEVDVLELDFETMSWITLKSLPGDQVLFIGLCSSFSMSGSGIIGISNCIYVFDDLLCKVSRYTMHNQEMMVCKAFPKSELLHKYGRFWARPTCGTITVGWK